MRSARFHHLLLLLAMAAALLMAVAPVVSRWLQSQHAQMAMPSVMMGGASADPHAGHHGMAHSAGTQMAMPPVALEPANQDPHAGHHGMAAAAKAHAAAHATPVPGTSQPVPADPHAAHGEACDYCTMASRLLPWLALLLVLGPLLYLLLPTAPFSMPVPASQNWRAHPARGPPHLC